MTTEREAVNRERAAFCRGFDRGLARPYEASTVIVTRLYPLPKITRQRVVRDNEGYSWKVEGSRIYSSYPGDNAWVEAWRGMACSAGWTPGRIALLAELLDNPTETVDDQ